MTPALLALTFVLRAPGLKEKKPEASPVGEWVAERRTFGGNERPLAGDPPRRTFAVYRGDRKVPTEANRYAVDPAKEPAAIDLLPGDTDPPGRTVVGIYKVEGDTLTLCLAHGPDPRPSAFESSEARPTTLYVFKRAKKKD
jgi:uncharacterized protein (TIGR03067 family)